jgi:3-oxoacyl-[acyl-carrier protein] reductase
MADAALKAVLKVVGYPTAPRLLRRVPILSKDLQGTAQDRRSQTVLQGMSVRIVSLLEDGESRKGLEEIVTTAGGAIDNSSDKVDAVICDTRGVDQILDLTKIHRDLNPLISKINQSGRLVLLGGDSVFSSRNIGAVAASEAVGGFAKSIALELGAKGITANALQIPTDINLNGSSTESGTVQFFLSKRSAFITGQVVPVSQSRFHAYHDTAAAAGAVDQTDNFAPHGVQPGAGSERAGSGCSFSMDKKRVIITGAARGIGEYTSRLYAAEGAQVLLVDHPSMETQLKALAVRHLPSLPYLSLTPSTD